MAAPALGNPWLLLVPAALMAVVSCAWELRKHQAIKAYRKQRDAEAIEDQA